MFSHTPTSIRRAAPALGEHTREVLAEVGVTDERYEQLRLDYVILIAAVTSGIWVDAATATTIAKGGEAR